MRYLLLCAVASTITSAAAPCTGEGLAVSQLRCEYRANPAGIDQLKPRFTWLVSSQEQGQRQTAYQLLVASSPEKLSAGEGDVWDSGKVESSETANIPYEGIELQSQTPYYWKVASWDRDGNQSAWSDVAHWSMGLLGESEWTAKYISYRDESHVYKDRESLFVPAARQYRRQVKLNKPIRRATIYATALGIYELHLNGQRVGDAYFAPGWTDYHQRAYYQTYDVTEMLKQGDNAIGAWVADGWYSGYVGFGLLTGIGTEQIGRYTYGKTPAVMAQIEIEFEDGSRTTIGTDESWRVTGEGPIREADMLMGEFYDATRETTGWTATGYDDSNWQAAILAEDNGKPEADFYQYVNPTELGKGPEKKSHVKDLSFKRPKLEAFPGVPVVITQELPCQEVTKREDGAYLFDLGQNFAGTYRLKVKGPKGHRLKLRFGEMLHPDGRLMTENLRKARSQDGYICRGDADGEVYSPRFTFHGFRYVEISNFPGVATTDTITGLVLHSDTPMASEFVCSDPTINRLFKNIVWTQRANFIDLPTDCPQRDERMGWTGDAQVYVASAAINADVSAFFTKWLRELMESQRPSGAFPGYAPFPFQHGQDFGTAWCDAGVICPWTVWKAYGDKRVIESCWQPMTTFMAWREQTSKNYLGTEHGNAWGDWLAQGEKTPLDYIDTAYFAVSSRMMAEMAEATGRDNEETKYRDQLARIKSAFADKYIKADGTLSVDSQTAYALAFYAQLIPDGQQEAFGKRLADKINANGNRMSTGFLGTYSLLPALTTGGQTDLAAFLLQSHIFPSWGYEVDQGATTIWERWDSYTKQDGFGRHNAAMNSFSHYAFGAVCQWMFETLAGIQAGSPSYEKIIIRPTPPSPGSNADQKPIDWVRASHDSIRGRISSSWRLKDGTFEIEVEIPTNTTALVYVPVGESPDVSIDGQSVEAHQHASASPKSELGRLVLELQSGSYKIVSTGAIGPAAEALHATAAKKVAGK